jgi:cell wall-associated NlpC family hydrolase
MTTTTRRTFTRALTTAGALVLTATMFTVSVPSAHASGTVATPVAKPTPAPAVTTKPKPKPSLGSRIVSVAATRRGSPYSYGASGPHRFDCSGLTMWTLKRLGHRLPHSAAAQYGRVKHIRASARRLGDLVFFHDGGGIYHVGIYAGHNKIWHAPYTGARVRKERLWTSSVYYGRIR